MKFHCRRMKLSFFSFFVLFLVTSNTLIAEIVWPIQEAQMNAAYELYIEDVHYAVLEGSGKVMAVADGTVQFVRQENFAGLPYLLVLKSDSGFLFSYFYIKPELSIGDRVSAGDIIGSIEEAASLLLSVYDSKQKTDVNAFAILPELDRYVIIKLEEMDFFYDSGETLEMQRNISSGSTDIHMVFSVQDKGASGYMLPYLIEASIDDMDFLISYDDIIKENSLHEVLDNGWVRVVLENVDLPRGYFDIKMHVTSPFMGKRRLFFNVFAKNNPVE